MGIIGDIGNIGVGIYNAITGNQNADRNLQFAKDKLAWDQNVQNTTWSREDTGIQRRVADLKKAGLSPVLAAGSAAPSGSVVSTTAPQRQQVNANLGAMDIDQSVLSLITQANNIAQTVAQTDYIKAQREKTLTDTMRAGVDLSSSEIGLENLMFDTQEKRKLGIISSSDAEMVNSIKAIQDFMQKGEVTPAGSSTLVGAMATIFGKLFGFGSQAVLNKVKPPVNIIRR